MRDRNTKRHYAYEAMQILLLLAMLLFITRLWPILLLVILGIFIAALRLLFLASEKVEPTEPLLGLPEPKKQRDPTEQDVQSMAYLLIQKRITQIIHEKYPDARWMWENPHAKEDIMAEKKVYVILNRAGGYRRGLVVIRNLKAVSIIYDAASDPARPEPNPQEPGQRPEETPPVPDQEPAEEMDIPEDYGLVAFQWVEANVLILNEKINEAIARKEVSLLIPVSELPAKESWEDICKELSRNGVTGANSRDTGILIEFEE